jgi:hypothetical protein
MIFALAGRRIDPVSAKTRAFPLENVKIVRSRIREALQTYSPRAMVSSAACGADLCSLLEAGELGIRRRVVIPFDREKFRKTSVTDRPGDWGAAYDQVLDEVTAKGDLLVLDMHPDDIECYLRTNEAILEEATTLSKDLGEQATAVLLWNRSSRGEDDATARFGESGKKRSLPVLEISTL